MSAGAGRTRLPPDPRGLPPSSPLAPAPPHRLGGIPVGVIAVETRTVEVVVPADPANLDSEAKVRGLGIWDCGFSWLSQPEWILGGHTPALPASGESLAPGAPVSSTVSAGCINVLRCLSSSGG